MMEINYVNGIGIAAGICTTLASLPQLIKAIKTQEVKDVSFKMFLVLITGVSLWTVYGILKEDWAITITNGISVILNVTLVVLLLYFQKKRQT